GRVRIALYRDSGTQSRTAVPRTDRPEVARLAMNASQITKKDLILLYRDRRTLSVLVALPLAFISILGFSTGQLFNKGQKARTVRVAVVDADDSPLSQKIIAELSGMKALGVTEFTDRSAARKEIAEDKTDVLLFIGPKYDERVADLELYDFFH